eukprot:3129631-Karenia_brevis.AAC.1
MNWLARLISAAGAVLFLSFHSAYCAAGGSQQQVGVPAQPDMVLCDFWQVQSIAVQCKRLAKTRGESKYQAP